MEDAEQYQATSPVVSPLTLSQIQAIERTKNPQYAKARKWSLILGWVWLASGFVLMLGNLLIQLLDAIFSLGVPKQLLGNPMLGGGIWAIVALAFIYAKNENRVLAAFMCLTGVSGIAIGVFGMLVSEPFVMSLIQGIILLATGVALLIHPLLRTYTARNKELIAEEQAGRIDQLPTTDAQIDLVDARRRIAIKVGILMSVMAVSYMLMLSAAFIPNETLSWIIIVACLLSTVASIALIFIIAIRAKDALGPLEGIVPLIAIGLGVMNLLMLAHKLLI